MRYDSLIFHHAETKQISFFGKSRKEAKRKEFDHVGCMHDLLSILYYVRNLDYTQYEKGVRIPLNIFFDKDLYPIEMEFGGKKSNMKIKGMGRHDVISIRPEAIDGHVFDEGTRMTIWASDDKRKIPLLVESSVRIGKVKGVLLREKSNY